jgi:PIN domain nuclease of toxin-antitoxin system
MPKNEINAPSIVLDTHIWIWASAGKSNTKFLQEYTGRCIIPAISVWEVAMLASRKRLTLNPSTESWVNKNLEAPSHLQALTPAIALRSTNLDDFHGDPADRLIVATALVLGVPLVSADKKIACWFRQHPEYLHGLIEVH